MPHYQFHIMTLSSGKKILIIDFGLDMLTQLISFECRSFPHIVIEHLELVLSGASKYQNITLNTTELEITPETTKIYDMLADDGMGDWCEIDTVELRRLVDISQKANRHLQEGNDDFSGFVDALD